MSLDSDLPVGFQVKYLGSVSFTKKKRRDLKGIISLQRPLLDLYTEARRRGENQRSIHPLALTQQLEICEYGLVVAEGSSRGDTVVTKVITPLDNVVLWAAVRFHARIIKKRVFGAAFVPLACSDGALDPKSYSPVSSNQRFLVSLSHPSLFACLHRSLASPSRYSCHAFVCAGAEDALAIANMATAASRPEPKRRWRRVPASLDSGTDNYSEATPEERLFVARENGIPRTDTEEESNSYASVFQKPHSSPRAITRRTGAPFRKLYTSHREARALIGGHGSPPRPLPEDEWRARDMMRREEEAHLRMSRVREERDYRPSEIPPPPLHTRSAYTMTDGPAGDSAPRQCIPPPTEVLAETIDLSSEKSSSSAGTKEGGWRPLLPSTGPERNNLVKYTYFGYERFAPRERDHGEKTKVVDIDVRKPREMVELRERTRHKSDESTKGVIHGNGTGKVTINVSYTPLSRTSSLSSIPRGVRSFQRNGHPRRWSSLSSTTSSTPSRKPTTQTSPKAIRWSEGERTGFFSSLRRFGVESLTKAKHRTGKFISSMKTRLMRTKRSSADGSEDSAYDTSEVCLSPSGRQPPSPRQTAPKARRQQSWSFHDLRTVERPVVRRSQHRRRGKNRRRSKRGAGRSSSSSDSGVEAASHSDSGRRSRSLDVTRVRVSHGMGQETFQRWSHTNIHDELGYIP